jgi:glycosyltransferase involved in cell wall biosynthesis
VTSRISAVVPVRNAAAYVQHALASVFAQSRPPDEVVVVDGASDDGTLDVVAGFAEVRVVHQTGRGLADARNLGIATTTGDLVAFLDADDRWLPDKSARQLAYLDRHPDVGVVAGHMMRLAAAAPTPPADAEKVPGLTPGATLIRRVALARVGPFDIRHRIGCDTDWLMRAREAGLGPALIPDTVLYKGVRGESLSRDVADYPAELLRVARDAACRRAEEDDAR